MRNEHRQTPFAKRSLGQNFLTDAGVIRRIVDAVDPSPADPVLEIGPGRGALTDVLVDRAGLVYALEFDRDLARLLRSRFEDRENFTLIEDDALAVDFAAIHPAGPLRLVANLPYNISTAILQRLFEFPGVFKDCVLMFQREVVDRITAAPGTKERGYLTVMVELRFHVEKLFDVPPAAFRPAPKVWSSVVRLVPKEPPIADGDVFQQVVAAGFAQKRKTILNNLKVKFPGIEQVLSRAGIDATRRAETLTLAEWISLAETIALGAYAPPFYAIPFFLYSVVPTTDVL